MFTCELHRIDTGKLAGHLLDCGAAAKVPDLLARAGTMVPINLERPCIEPCLVAYDALLALPAYTPSSCITFISHDYECECALCASFWSYIY